MMRRHTAHGRCDILRAIGDGNMDYDPHRDKIRRPESESVTKRAVLSNVPSEPCVENEWILVHPTKQTCLFKEILSGQWGYTEGQGVYNSIRSAEAVSRQLQSTIINLTLEAARYDELHRDWMKHIHARGMSAKKIAKRYGRDEAEATRVARRVFETWHKTLQRTLVNLFRRLMADLVAHDPNICSFAKYIDWMCCLGIVPVIRRRRAAHSILQSKDNSHNMLGGEFDSAACRLLTVQSIMDHGRQITDHISASMQAVTIIEYDRAIIEYNFLKRQLRVRDAISGERGECIVIWRPVMSDNGVVFDSPMQRICKEIVECHDLRIHAALCRLINTPPVRVLIAKRDPEKKGVSGAQRAVEQVLGDQVENAAGSAASRLVKLIIGLKGMRHVGEITDTVRDYLEETNGHLLDTSSVDTSQPGFGRLNRTHNTRAADGSHSNNANIRDAFHASVVSNINEMLEGYVNKLFSTVEGLKATNKDLVTRLSSKELELDRIRMESILAKQAHADMSCHSQYSPNLEMLARDLKHDIIDVGANMDDDSYVANSFQSRYIPCCDTDLRRLSDLWEQELMRCFKMNRVMNSQAKEIAILYSNSSITSLLAPYFFNVLNIYDIGLWVDCEDVYKSEEDLCNSLFQKTRVHTYLQDLATFFEVDVRRAVAKLSDVFYWGRPDTLEIAPDLSYGRRDKHRPPPTRFKLHSGRFNYRRSKRRRRSGSNYRRTDPTAYGENDDGD
ncbi:UL6 minor capsid protein [Meleagrid alphaherpesvirus 1]|uniref:UL6 minor capsid protein n=1 Tax=Meleagrid herpesvirus 1 TaxID=37108 RepID=Q9DPS8_MEHV1|nr:capsid portal protein [Meleagrid alphaherpesvirus 1]AKQ48598.1 capsid portal protein [iBAC vector pMeHV1-C7]AKQ48670.1 capsid portal protein [iBAC vector pMeHV1-C9]AKQ48742.1 capsid portal protein [iBAC vector pMeHV1-C10]AKQ48814.1 capsid portal protein [iBAC vector pMeHV1-C17]AKQ48886.1 capsid portal protein [iBAC vector pMeHV1-C18]